MKLLFFTILFVVMYSLVNGCKKTIEPTETPNEKDEDGVEVEVILRSVHTKKPQIIPFFTSCLIEETYLPDEIASMYVNFVISHDIWYTATSDICRSDAEPENCWHQSAHNLIKKNSQYFDAFQICIGRFFRNASFLKRSYFNSIPTGSCSVKSTNIGYRKIFKPKCDRRFDFETCMTAEQERNHYYCDVNGERRKFDFNVLGKFINENRADCKFTKIGKSYQVNCDTPLNNVEDSTLVKYEWLAKILRRNVELRSLFQEQNWVFERPMKRSDESSCFAKRLIEVLSPDSYLQEVCQRCIVREHNSNQEYKSIVGWCPINSYWTEWMDESNPKRSWGSDVETIKSYQQKYRRSYYKLNICKRPRAVEVRTTKDQPFSTTGDYLSISPTTGLECFSIGNTKCQNYKVRFCCEIGY